MQASLTELIRMASARAAKEMAAEQRVSQHFLLIREGVANEINEPRLRRMGVALADPDDRDRLGLVIRVMLRLAKCDQYLHYSEVWAKRMAPETSLDNYCYGELEHDPERYEMIHYVAEDSGGQLQGTQSIIRPAGQPPILADDLAINVDPVEGRFAGMFKPDPVVDAQVAKLAYLEAAGLAAFDG